MTAVAALLTGGVAAAAPSDAPRDVPIQAVEVAAGVYMMQGASGEVDTDNLGRIGNAGFIVGEGGVVAIDTGTSYRHGVALLAAIRRVTDKPVRLALITHTRQEFLFGAAAYREQAIPIHMHSKAAGLMRSRCERCLKTLKQQLGEDAMLGTVMFKPDLEFEQPQTIDVIGRRLQVLYFGHSSGPGDVALLDQQSGVLFAGGLLDEQRIPDVQDADLDGWTQALQALRRLPVKAVVPGHGPVASVKVIDAVDALPGRTARARAGVAASRHGAERGARRRGAAGLCAVGPIRDNPPAQCIDSVRALRTRTDVQAGRIPGLSVFRSTACAA